MRACHMAAIAVLGLVASVVSYQAVTAKPPEPYVRLIGDGRPNAPWIRTECRDGTVWRVYTTSDNAEIDMPTTLACP